MNDEQWEKIKDTVKDRFEVLEEETEEGENENEIIEFIEVMSEAGKIKLERITKPKVLDVKATYSKRGQSTSGVKFIHSNEEVVHTVKAYKWDDQQDTWMPIDTTNILQG